MNEQTRIRACRALCRNNEQRKIFDCVWVVDTHVCFQDYVAAAWWREYNKEMPIEVISYEQSKQILVEYDTKYRFK